MMAFVFLVLTIILFLINFFFKKKNFFIDKSTGLHDSHKKFINIKNNTIPLSGGFFFLIFLIFVSDPVLILLFTAIFIIGFLSDFHFVTSVKIRIVSQFFIILFLVIYSENTINDIRIPIFNFLLDYQMVSIIFTTFCILILINGSNFIDGVNTLLCGYIIIVLTILMYVSNHYSLIFDKIFFQYFLLFLGVFFIFNFFNKSFLGDSGAYLIGCYLGFSLVLFFQKNHQISPYFIVVLLWYPAFENLFSIVKRLLLNKKSYLPDSTHLHHKIFLFLSKKIDLNKGQLSTFTGLLINLYNFFIFFIAAQDITNTKMQVKIIFFNIIFYLISYYFLFKKVDKKYGQ
jgi:UDP-N-acetylmuramyl pentapeptide phosphotransferase/UDP-N-acetylglucosamine-1-phosphate transferase